MLTGVVPLPSVYTCVKKHWYFVSNTLRREVSIVWFVFSGPRVGFWGGRLTRHMHGAFPHLPYRGVHVALNRLASQWLLVLTHSNATMLGWCVVWSLAFMTCKTHGLKAPAH